MVHKDFNLDEASWTKDYKGAREKLKEAVMQSATLHFPDYSLPGIYAVMHATPQGRCKVELGAKVLEVMPSYPLACWRPTTYTMREHSNVYGPWTAP